MSENIKNTAAESAQNAAGAAEAVTHDMTAEAVNEPVQADAGVYTHTFKKPFEYAGETYTTLTFDFEKMTGRDMVSIETEMQMNNEYCLAPEVSRSFRRKWRQRPRALVATFSTLCLSRTLTASPTRQGVF